MKRIVGLSLVFCIAIIAAAHAKSSYECEVIYPAKGGSAAKIFASKKIVWAGMDFRKVKCVGPEIGFIESTLATEANKDKVIRTQDFKNWNEQIVTADGTSLLAKLFVDKEVKIDLSSIMKINEKSNATGIWSLEDQKVELTTDEIKSMVSSQNP